MKLLKTSVLAMLLAFAAHSAHAAEFVVKYRNQPGQLLSARAQTLNEYRVLDQHRAGNLLKIDVNNSNLAKILGTIMQMSEVEYVVPNFRLQSYTLPGSPAQTREQWAIAKTRAQEAWAKVGKGSRNVLVAVIDTGVDYRHESLAPNMVPGYDFKDNDSDPMDATGSANPGHGTHCAGIVGATGLIDNGIYGLSPEVSLMPLRFLGADGGGDLMNGIKSIDYAIEKGAEVISASWGATVSTAQAQPLIDAVKRASDKGIIFVVAAANDGKSNDRVSVYPANAKFENTISVAASGPQDEKPSWSNFGKLNVDVAAPGLDIMSTLPGNQYKTLSGTSMATPLVSGLVALLKAQDASLTGAEIRSIIQSSGAQVNIETACNCRVDAAAAVDSVIEKKLTIVPAAANVIIDSTAEFKTVFAEGAVSFKSSDPSVASITETGTLKGLKAGEVTLTAVDAAGRTAQSLKIYVHDGKKPGGGGDGGFPWPGDPGQPPWDGECMLGDPALCAIICMLFPQLPFCSQAQANNQAIESDFQTFLARRREN